MHASQYKGMSLIFQITVHVRVIALGRSTPQHNHSIIVMLT